MPFLTINSIDNDPLLVKLIGELRSAIKASNLTSGLAKTFSEKIEEVIAGHSLGLDPKGTVITPAEYFKNIATIAGRLNEKLLYAGLTLMCWDIAMDPNKVKEGESELGQMTIDIFDELCTPFEILKKTEIEYSTQGPSIKILKVGFFNGEINTVLQDAAIIHEWTVGPGEKIFETLKERFKEYLCTGDECLYAKLEKGSFTGDVVQVIVSTLLAKGLSNTLWVPILTYFAVLLMKTGVKTYCEAE